MADFFVPRAAADQLRDAVMDFRVVIVNGARQAGKTTLLEMFQERRGGTYRSLDEAEYLQAALADPVSFIQQGERPLIIDEIQRAGNDIILAIKREVDSRRIPGQFILSGSTKFLAIPTLSESLAGRADFVDLWPFCMAERTKSDHHLIKLAFTNPSGLIGMTSTWDRTRYLDLICAGSYPEVGTTRLISCKQPEFDRGDPGVCVADRAPLHCLWTPRGVHLVNLPRAGRQQG